MLAATFAAAPLNAVLGQSWKERDGNPTETPPTQSDPLANYSKASFVSYLNSIFQIQTVFGIVDVTLAKVDDMTAPKGGECFSLLFRGGAKALKQDTYMVVHPSLGTFQLFVVPAGSDKNGAHEYLSVINRISLVDFTNMTAPSRTATGSRGGGTQSSSGNSSSASEPTSTTSSATQATGLTVTQTTIGAAAAVTSKSFSLGQPRKRKPTRKRVDPKTPLIN